jgi:hypothetical protein
MAPIAGALYVKLARSLAVLAPLLSMANTFHA